MVDHVIKNMTYAPGIKKDQTIFNSQNWTDGQWVRFFGEGFTPKKIGGMRLFNYARDAIARTLFPIENKLQANSFNLYLGYSDGVFVMPYTSDLIEYSLKDRTPEDYESDSQNIWTFDQMTLVIDGVSYSNIIAHVAPNLNNIASTAEGKIYAGDINSNAPLIEIEIPNKFTSAGGIIVLSPYLIIYGENGIIQWSSPNDIVTWPEQNYAAIANSKIVKALAVRGNTPSALFWTQTQLIQASYDPALDTFVSNTVVNKTSILSPNSVVSYNDVFYWIGQKQFYAYNGVLNTIENIYNQQYFFDNLNEDQKNKVFGVVLSEFDEIWWFWPSGVSEECNEVLVYNIKGKFWYNLELSRSAGIDSTYTKYPIFADNIRIANKSSIASTDFSYPVWVHEYGVNISKDGQEFALTSYIYTPFISVFQDNPQLDKNIRLRCFNKDMLQKEKILIKIENYAYPNSDLDPKKIKYYEMEETAPKRDLSSTGRLVRIGFISNATNGDFWFGMPLIEYNLGGDRKSS